MNQLDSAQTNQVRFTEQLSRSQPPAAANGAAPPRRKSAKRRRAQDQGWLADRANATGDAHLRIALIDRHEFTRGCIETSLHVLCSNISVVTFPTVADCIASDLSEIDLVFYHSHGLETGDNGVNDNLITLKLDAAVTPVIVVSGADDFNSILEALTAGARGYIPTSSTSLAVTIEAIRLVRAGGTFAPVSVSLMQKAGSSRPEAAAASSLVNRFTPRQMAVLEHLKQGNANKTIAHELAMSEGTVKVHVRNIMKKLHATNRTQAVFRAYSGLGAERVPAEAISQRTRVMA